MEIKTTKHITLTSQESSDLGSALSKIKEQSEKIGFSSTLKLTDAEKKIVDDIHTELK